MTKFTDFIIFNKITGAFLVMFDINDIENPYGEWDSIIMLSVSMRNQQIK